MNSVQYPSYHPAVQELRRLREEPMDRENAQNFLNYLERQFPNGSWERHLSPKQEVEAYLNRLDRINYNWAADIRNSIRSTNHQINALRQDVHPSDTEPASIQSVTSQNLENINISRELAYALGESTISNPLTREAIYRYQQRQNISSDRIIGRETYLEMRAGEINNGIRSSIDNINGLSDRIYDIKLILENGTKTGVNVIALRLLLRSFENTHEDNPQFNNLYQEFFNWYNDWEEGYNNSEQGLRDTEIIDTLLSGDELPGDIDETPEQREQRQSLYRRIQSGEYGAEEALRDVGNLATHPFVLLIIGGLFLFGKFGAGSKFTDAFWKRALLLGVGIFNLDSLRDMRDDAISGYNNHISPRHESEGARENIYRNWNNENSELRQHFPDSGFFEAVENKFTEDSALRFIKLEDISGYIEKINEGNISELPGFLQNIEVSGQQLTPEQLRAYLNSLLVAGQGTSYTYIHEINDEPRPLTLASTMTVISGGFALGAAVLGAPFTAGVAALVGTGSIVAKMAGYDISLSDLIAKLQATPEGSRALREFNEILETLPEGSEVKNEVVSILQSETGNKIEGLQGLKQRFPEYSEIIDNIILRSVSIQSTTIEVSFFHSDFWGRLGVRELESDEIQQQMDALETLRSSISGISGNESVGEQINTLIERLETEKIQKINEEASRERINILEAPGRIEGDITTLRGEIESLQARIIIEESNLRSATDSQNQERIRGIIEDLHSTVRDKRLQIQQLESQFPEAQRSRSDILVEDGIRFANNLIATIPSNIESLNITDIRRILSDYDSSRRTLERYVEDSTYAGNEKKQLLESLYGDFNEILESLEVRLEIEEQRIIESHEQILQDIEDRVRDFDFLDSDTLERLQNFFSSQIREENQEMLERGSRDISEIESLYIEKIIQLRENMIQEIQDLDTFNIQTARERVNEIQQLDSLMESMSWQGDITSLSDLQEYIRTQVPFVLIDGVGEVVTEFRDIKDSENNFIIPDDIRGNIDVVLERDETKISELIDVISRPAFNNIRENTIRDGKNIIQLLEELSSIS
ncbi:hypothetical protein LAT59_01680 [Candidatus Gracilibacteria bacterium]|nr:hypothetical protein [Candidatus Gracilibacteria bacterium]